MKKSSWYKVSWVLIFVKNVKKNDTVSETDICTMSLTCTRNWIVWLRLFDKRENENKNILRTNLSRITLMKKMKKSSFTKRLKKKTWKDIKKEIVLNRDDSKKKFDQKKNNKIWTIVVVEYESVNTNVDVCSCYEYNVIVKFQVVK